jgi:hypothetical protein
MNYASRLEKLEQEASDWPMRVVGIMPGESEQDAIDRCAASADVDANALRRAHAAGRICFMSGVDLML